MSHRPLEDSQLSDLIEFDRQLRGYIQAGLPLQGTPGTAPSDLASQSESIVSQTALSVAKGGSFSRSYADATKSSELYRLAFAGWFVTGENPEAFDLFEDPQREMPVARTRWNWPLQFCILITIAYVTLCIWLATGAWSLNQLYINSRLERGFLGECLNWIYRNVFDGKNAFAIPGLILVFAALVGLCVYIWRRPISISSADELWMGKRNLSQYHRVRLIQLLTRSGVGLAEAISLHQQMEVSAPVIEPAPANTTDTSIGLPTIARYWMSREGLTRRFKTRSFTLPYVLYIGASGLVVLLVALSVFGPMIEYLFALGTKGEM